MSMFAPFSFPAVTYGMMCFSFRFTLHVQVCRPWQNQTQTIFFPIRRLVTQGFSKFWSTAENKIENARLCPLSLHLVRIFSGQHVAGGSFEEFQHGLIFERRRIRDIHDHLRSCYRLGQTFSGNRINALGRRCRNDFVATRTEEVHYFASNEAPAAEDDYFHIFIFGFRCLSLIMTASSWCYGCLPKRFSVAERFEPACFHARNPMAFHLP